uniref:Uncharacterized protein n=1 Tax=Daphnia galeata TaxID=27404 RepID=A0A8J2W583_9CRUS|nr:unnamed protein product [Daphnia galeata]
MLDMEEIETRPPSHFEKRARVFVLKIDYVADPLMDCIQNLIGGSSNTNSRRNKELIFKLPARWGSNEKNVYHIGFVPASLTIKDATIKKNLYPARPLISSAAAAVLLGYPASSPIATCLLLPGVIL